MRIEKNIMRKENPAVIIDHVMFCVLYWFLHASPADAGGAGNGPDGGGAAAPMGRVAVCSPLWCVELSVRGKCGREGASTADRGSPV
jgi:hypothetical protein